MTMKNTMKRLVPSSVKRALRPFRNRLLTKYDAEMLYWKRQHSEDHGSFRNSNYRQIMLAMAGETDDAFVRGKIVADFGCGPRGSLAWAHAAQVRIGIDVLADRYADAFHNDLVQHGMVYVKSTEQMIPLPSDFVDVFFTMNAIDHVDHFDRICAEILRVLKPNGDFVGSFNLEEPPTRHEPQQLSETSIHEYLLRYMEVLSSRASRKAPGPKPYQYLLDGTPSYEPGEEGVLWVRARKPA